MWWVPKPWFRKAGLHHYADGLEMWKRTWGEDFLDIEMASLRLFLFFLKSIAFQSDGPSNPQKTAPLKQPWQTNSSPFQSRDIILSPWG
jgi:hypothetical protein